MCLHFVNCQLWSTHVVNNWSTLVNFGQHWSTVPQQLVNFGQLWSTLVNILSTCGQLWSTSAWSTFPSAHPDAPRCGQLFPTSRGPHPEASRFGQHLVNIGQLWSTLRVSNPDFFKDLVNSWSTLVNFGQHLVNSWSTVGQLWSTLVNFGQLFEFQIQIILRFCQHLVNIGQLWSTCGQHLVNIGQLWSTSRVPNPDFFEIWPMGNLPHTHTAADTTHGQGNHVTQNHIARDTPGSAAATMTLGNRHAIHTHTHTHCQ